MEYSVRISVQERNKLSELNFTLPLEEAQGLPSHTSSRELANALLVKLGQPELPESYEVGLLSYAFGTAAYFWARLKEPGLNRR